MIHFVIMFTGSHFQTADSRIESVRALGSPMQRNKKPQSGRPYVLLGRNHALAQAMEFNPVLDCSWGKLSAAFGTETFISLRKNKDNSEVKDELIILIHARMLRISTSNHPSYRIIYKVNHHKTYGIVYGQANFANNSDHLNLARKGCGMQIGWVEGKRKPLVSTVTRRYNRSYVTDVIKLLTDNLCQMGLIISTSLFLSYLFGQRVMTYQISSRQGLGERTNSEHW